MLGLAAVLSHPEAKADPPNSPFEKLFFVLDHMDHINKTTMSLALGSLAFLIFIRSVKPRLVNRPGAKWVRFVPEILLAVVIGTGEHLKPRSRAELTTQLLRVSSDWMREVSISSVRSRLDMVLRLAGRCQRGQSSIQTILSVDSSSSTCPD